MDTQILYQKLSDVPTTIKIWLGSNTAIATIDELEGRFTLPAGSSSTIAKLIQKIQIKDIAPDYFSGELAAELQLDKDKAVHITSELKKNLFSPRRKDFSDYGIDIDLLDKFQAPTIKSPISDTPKILDSAIPQPIQKNFSTPIPGAMPPTKKPTTLSDVGWSRSSSAGPGIQLSAVPAASGSTHTPPPAPVPPAPPSPKEPAPVMLHEDTSFKAAEKNSGFTLSRPGAGADAHIQGGPVVPAPPKPAVLEFGGVPKPPAATKQNNTPQSGAVHYSDFKVSLSAMPTVSSGPRNVDQVVPPPPVPVPTATTAPLPTPPTPSAIPVSRPPQAPQVPQPPKPPQSNKPIVKDFL